MSDTIYNNVAGDKRAFHGESQGSDGMLGVSHAAGRAGIAGVNDDAVGNGVYGRSAKGNGVIGYSDGQGHSGVAGSHSGHGNGTYGESQAGDGVLGISHAPGKAGVAGVNDDAVGNGVYGRSAKGNGIVGYSDGQDHSGVAGSHSGAGNGVYGESQAGDGIVGLSHSIHKSGVAGVAVNPQGTGPGVYAESRGKGAAFYGKGPLAAVLDGDVVIGGNVVLKGDLTCANADCAENFELEPTALTIEAGMVLTIGSEGLLKPCAAAYDTRVAGVISGAGSYRPAIILNKEPGSDTGVPVALVGRACCLVDATYGGIEAGDLLTTSATPGHAMKASELTRAFGSIVGKALAPLSEGRGLIPVLIVMQ